MSEEKLIKYLNNQIDEVTKQLENHVNNITPVLNSTDSVAIYESLSAKRSVYEEILNFAEAEKESG